MTITVQSPFKSAARISRAAWMREIQVAFPTPLFNGIPDEDKPDVARAMYDTIAQRGHDPAIWLGIGWCEHRLGTDANSVLHRNDTRSLTNARTVRDRSLTGWEVVKDAVRGSNYVKYASVVDSLQDGLYRVDEPGYAYRKANAVSIIDHTMIWTEGDGPQYAAKMAVYMNRVIAEDTGEIPMPPLTPPPGWTPPEIVRRILPRDASNTPQRTMDWQYITVHNTGNSAPTANALMHAGWLESLAKAGASEPSWQYTVDDMRVVQHLEDDQAGWHASDGDGPGNLASLGFELVEIGDQERVLWNAGFVMAQKLRSKGKDTSWMRQHYDWARDKKNCPRLLRANDGAGWKRLLAIVGSFLDDTPAPTDDGWRLHLGNGQEAPFPFVLGFRAFVEAQARARFPDDPNSAALAMFGPAEEYQWRGVDGRDYQRTRKVVLVYTPGNAVPWDVSILDRDAVLPERA